MRALTLTAGGERPALPPASPARLADWRTAYNELVGALGRHFPAASEWWFVPLSSRDHFMSSLQDDLHLLAGLEEALSRPDTDALHFHCESREIAMAAAELGRRQGWRIDIPFGARAAWFGRDLDRRWRNGRAALSRIVWLLRHWRTGRVYGDWRAHTTGLDAVFVSPIHGPAGGDERDVYFGDLPVAWHSQGRKVAIAGPALCDPLAVARASKVRQMQVPRYTLDSLIGFGTAFSLALQGMVSWLVPPRVPDIASGIPAARKFVRREIADAVASRIHGRHIERAFADLLRRSPGARVLHTYENNWWERAIDHPAAARPNAPATVGYLHCPVIGAHLKNYVSRAEANRPAPDRVVCTGPAARELYLALGEHDASRVMSGAALRGPDFSALPLRHGAGTRPLKTLLVLLEGLPTMVPLLSLLEAARPLLAGRRLIVRPHPVLPLDQVAPRAGLSLSPDGVIVAGGTKPLLDEIEDADAVIFKASSTAFVAGYMGLPLLRYRDDWWLSDDPLADCAALKQDFSTPRQLLAAIEHFERMDAATLDAQRQELRDYLPRYFAPQTPAAMTAFA